MNYENGDEDADAKKKSQERKAVQKLPKSLCQIQTNKQSESYFSSTHNVVFDPF